MFISYIRIVCIFSYKVKSIFANFIENGRIVLIFFGTISGVHNNKFQAKFRNIYMNCAAFTSYDRISSYLHVLNAVFLHSSSAERMQVGFNELVCLEEMNGAIMEVEATQMTLSRIENVSLEKDWFTQEDPPTEKNGHDRKDPPAPTEENASAQEDCPAPTEENSSAQKDVPARTENGSAQKHSPTPTEESCPAQKKCPAQTEENSSAQIDCLAPTENGPPQKDPPASTEESCPAQKDFSAQTEENCPAQKYCPAPTKENGPAQKLYASQTST